MADPKEMIRIAEQANRRGQQTVADAALEGARQQAQRMLAINPPKFAIDATAKAVEGKITRLIQTAERAGASLVTDATERGAVAARDRIMRYRPPSSPRSPGGGSRPRSRRGGDSGGGSSSVNQTDAAVIQALRRYQFATFQLTAGAQDIAAVLQNGGSFYQAINGAANNLGVMASMAGPSAAIFGTMGIIALPLVIKGLEVWSDKIFFSAQKAQELAEAQIKQIVQAQTFTERIHELNEMTARFTTNLEDQAKSIEATVAKEVAGGAFTDEQEEAIKKREAERLGMENTEVLRNSLRDSLEPFEKEANRVAKRGWFNDFLTNLTLGAMDMAGAGPKPQDREFAGDYLSSKIQALTDYVTTMTGMNPIKRGLGLRGLDRSLTDSKVQELNTKQMELSTEAYKEILPIMEKYKDQVENMSPEDFLDVVATRGTDAEKKAVRDFAAGKQQQVQTREAEQRQIELMEQQLAQLEEMKQRATTKAGEAELGNRIEQLKEVLDKLQENLTKEVGSEKLSEQERTNKYLQELVDLTRKNKL